MTQCLDIINKEQYFSEEELFIGYNYWNFVCNDDEGFNIVFKQYKISCQYIKDSLEKIKQLYFSDINKD